MTSLIETSMFSAGDEDEAPVYYRTRKIFGRKIWYFRRYEDVKYILNNPEIYSNQRAKIGLKWLERAYASYEFIEPSFVGKSLLFVDPPDHNRIRKVVNKAFTPNRMKALQVYIHEVVDALLDNLAMQSAGDILNDYAYPIAKSVVIKLLGFPAKDYHKLRLISQVQKRPQYKLRNSLIYYRYARWVREVYAERAVDLGDDLLSMLIKGEKAGEISYDEAIQTYVFLAMGGFETTANFIGNAVLALLLHPEEMKKIKIGAGLTEKQLEELLRYCNLLSKPLTRWAIADGIVGGVEVNRGDVIIASLIGANHDPSTFDNANQLDLKRTKNPHMAFGYGVHFCIGAPLARLEGKIALDSIIARFPKLRLAVEPEELSKIPGWIVGALEELPVRWD